MVINGKKSRLINVRSKKVTVKIVWKVSDFTCSSKATRVTHVLEIHQMFVRTVAVWLTFFALSAITAIVRAAAM